MPHQRPCDWEWSLHISFTTSTLYQSISWSMETTKVIQVGKPPSLRIMLWSLLPCCSLYIMIKAFNDCGWSNVIIGATSYFAAWLLMDESLYSQDFLGLSQWQELGDDMPVSSFWRFLSFRLKMAFLALGLIFFLQGYGGNNFHYK